MREPSQGNSKNSFQKQAKVKNQKMQKHRQPEQKGQIQKRNNQETGNGFGTQVMKIEYKRSVTSSVAIPHKEENKPGSF